MKSCLRDILSGQCRCSFPRSCRCRVPELAHWVRAPSQFTNRGCLPCKLSLSVPAGRLLTSGVLEIKSSPDHRTIALDLCVLFLSTPLNKRRDPSFGHLLLASISSSRRTSAVDAFPPTVVQYRLLLWGLAILIFPALYAHFASLILFSFCTPFNSKLIRPFHTTISGV